MCSVTTATEQLARFEHHLPADACERLHPLLRDRVTHARLATDSAETGHVAAMRVHQRSYEKCNNEIREILRAHDAPAHAYECAGLLAPSDA